MNFYRGVWARIKSDEDKDQNQQMLDIVDTPHFADFFRITENKNHS